MISLRSFVHLQLILLVVAFACPAAAGDVDLLIQKLVSKGILTESDAQELAAEIGREARAGTPAVRQLNELPAVGAVARTQVDHLERIRFTGDLRVRYQLEDLHNAPLAGTLNVEDRDRWRLPTKATSFTETSSPTTS